MKPYIGNFIAKVVILVFRGEKQTPYKDAIVYKVRRLIPKWAIGQAFGDYILTTNKSNTKTLSHEYTHCEQWRKFGFIGLGFILRYAWYSFRYGYKHNPLEVEAYQKQ